MPIDQPDPCTNSNTAGDDPASLSARRSSRAGRAVTQRLATLTPSKARLEALWARRRFRAGLALVVVASLTASLQGLAGPPDAPVPVVSSQTNDEFAPAPAAVPDGPPLDDDEGRDRWPALPARAWVAPGMSYVRVEPKWYGKLEGVLRTGDQVVITACVPDCQAKKAFAQLEPYGFVPLRDLRPGLATAVAKGQGASMQYIYGHNWKPTPVYAKPDRKSKVLRKEKTEYRLAFVPDEGLLTTGWLRRPDGGYMRYADIKLFSPSKFAGSEAPALPYAFVRRKVAVRADEAKRHKKGEELRILQRYDRDTVRFVRGDKVFLQGGGWVPKSMVRLVRQQARPKGVGPDDKWLHVDLQEQVLTAWQGDTLQYATLVSTGKSDRAATKTPTGNFQVYAQTIHSSMRGQPWDDYFAEEVPHVLHFDGGRALHGAYWHDQFGIEKSHGCINLSPADAAWLYGWLPTQVPDGWHSILAVQAGRPAARIVIEDGKRAPGKGKSGPSLANADAPPENCDDQNGPVRGGPDSGQ